MPNFDGTGPLGQGGMTGRRRGRCRDNQKNENQNTESKEVLFGLGRGGRPRGGGKGNCFGDSKNKGRGRFGNR